MNMSRNKVVEWDVVEKGLRVLDYELPESQEEAVKVLRKYLEISEDVAKEIYGYWVVT